MILLVREVEGSPWSTDPRTRRPARRRTRSTAGCAPTSSQVDGGPGSRLPFAELCARYQASAGVVREGLARLAEEGLVVAMPQRGFRVIPLTADDLRDLTEVRRLNESLALRSAVVEGDAAWEARIALADCRLERTPQPGATDPGPDGRSVGEAHDAFHAALLSGCRNRRLLAIALAARDASGLYQRWTLSIGPRPDRDAPAEHREMLDAALARDPEAPSPSCAPTSTGPRAVLWRPSSGCPRTGSPNRSPRTAVSDVAL